METATGWLADDDTPGWLGLDVGGANLKIADGRGRAASTPFALWKSPELLADALRACVAAFAVESTERVALTMTGELADCYANKAEGVRAIVAATSAALPEATLRVAGFDGEWRSAEQACDEPIAVAAANWALSARLVARNHPTGRGVWIDVGSTTTDIVPIELGRIAPLGFNDTERLIHGELVYTGVRRTPVCAVVDRLPYRGNDCPVAAEWFATTVDAWVLLGEIDEDADDTDTADGRPLTREAATHRLARCVGADESSFTVSDAIKASHRVAERQTTQVVEALEGLEAGWVVVGGEGAFLARRALGLARIGAEPTLVVDRLGDSVSRCFPAHAASVLAGASANGE